MSLKDQETANVVVQALAELNAGADAFEKLVGIDDPQELVDAIDALSPGKMTEIILACVVSEQRVRNSHLSRRRGSPTLEAGG